MEIINKEPSQQTTQRYTHSKSICIVLSSPGNAFVDRLHISLGELLLRRTTALPPYNSNEKLNYSIPLFRYPQNDFTFSASQNHLRQLSNAPQQPTPDPKLHSLSSSSTMRIYTFPSHSALHTFQSSITGNEFLFDSTPSTFIISHLCHPPSSLKNTTTSTRSLKRLTSGLLTPKSWSPLHHQHICNSSSEEI